MKRFFISDFQEYNKTALVDFRIDSRNIHEIILVDDLKEIYYYYNHHDITSNNFRIKDKHYNIKGSIIPTLKDLYLLNENKFNEILNLKTVFVRGYFKNNFLKLFNLEEFII